MPRAIVEIKGQAERNLIARWAMDTQNVPAGTTVEFRAPRRSLDQNALMWSLLGQISKQVDWYGQKLSSEDWKDVLTASLRGALETAINTRQDRPSELVAKYVDAKMRIAVITVLDKHPVKGTACFLKKQFLKARMAIEEEQRSILRRLHEGVANGGKA